MIKRFAMMGLSMMALYAPAALAASNGMEARALTFGQFVVTGNAPQTITIAPGNVENHSTGITKLLQGQSGVFRLTGLHPMTAVTVTLMNSPLAQAQKLGGADIRYRGFHAGFARRQLFDRCRRRPDP